MAWLGSAVSLLPIHYGRVCLSILTTFVVGGFFMFTEYSRISSCLPLQREMDVGSSAKGECLIPLFSFIIIK